VMYSIPSVERETHRLGLIAPETARPNST